MGRTPKRGHHLYKPYHQLTWRNPGSGSQTVRAPRGWAQRRSWETLSTCVQAVWGRVGLSEEVGRAVWLGWWAFQRRLPWSRETTEMSAQVHPESWGHSRAAWWAHSGWSRGWRGGETRFPPPLRCRGSCWDQKKEARSRDKDFPSQ